jgi:murein DD-endopeptidase MepM/ murein hydrolase activator NlpD
MVARVLALALVLIAPVTGSVERGFDAGRPFEAGRHRGVDLAAPPGSKVRAACGGPVVFAGRIGGAGIVTLRCGRWRVTHMPLATIAARGIVRQGAVLGTVARSREHAGLHLGVRRDGTRFGYADPLRFMARRPPPLGPAPRPARPPPRSIPPIRVRPSAAPRPASLPFAPWPAWAGLALVLAGAGVRVRARRRACSNPVAAAAER